MSFGAVDVQQHKTEYENEVCAILHTPARGGGGGGGVGGGNDATKTAGGAPRASGSGSSSAAATSSTVPLVVTMQFGSKLKQMNAEFEDLLGMIDVFCYSKDTARNIETYNKKRTESQDSVHKRRRKRNDNEVIPIQLVAGNRPLQHCTITANSMSSILLCNSLHSNSVLATSCFLDFVKKTTDCAANLRLEVEKPEATGK